MQLCKKPVIALVEKIFIISSTVILSTYCKVLLLQPSVFVRVFETPSLRKLPMLMNTGPLCD